jgi:hypothetical protein
MPLPRLDLQHREAREGAERGMDRFAMLVEEDGTVVIDTSEILFGAPEGIVTFTDPHPADVGCL